SGRWSWCRAWGGNRTCPRESPRRSSPCCRGPCEMTPRALCRRSRSSLFSSIPADGLLRQIDVHLLHVEILLDAPLAQLAADAALLVAAPGRLDIGRQHVVHPDDAGAQ